MTSGTDSPQTDAVRAPSRHLIRRSPAMMARTTPPAARAPQRDAPRWSRRRRVLSVFATVAAVGFAAASIGPTAMALAVSPAQDPVSLYAASEGDQQSLLSAGGVPAPIDLGRASYSVYVTPKPEPVAQSAGAALTRPFYSGGGSKDEWLSASGISEADWGYVDFIVKKESGWNPNAVNRSSGASGLVQALPCSKVPGSCFDPVDNLRWANGYATKRYGSWESAFAFWTKNHWW